MAPRLLAVNTWTTQWETYRTAIIEAIAPAGPVETALAGRATSALWRLRRVTAYEEAAIAEAHRMATCWSLGSLAERCGWATCGLPCGPQPDTRHCSLHRGESEHQHRNRPMTRAILRRHGLAVRETGGGTRLRGRGSAGRPATSVEFGTAGPPRLTVILCHNSGHFL